MKGETMKTALDDLFGYNKSATRKTRTFNVEWRDYTGKWNHLFSVEHIDIDGAARWAGRRVREALAALNMRPKTMVRVSDDRSDRAVLVPLSE